MGDLGDNDSEVFNPQPNCLDITKAYDPLNLDALRQPRPNDQPLDLPDSFFTFEDAFEDLLSATFTGEICPIAYLASKRLTHRIELPDGRLPAYAEVTRLAALYENLRVRRHDSLILGPETFQITRHPKTGKVQEHLAVNVITEEVSLEVAMGADPAYTPAAQAVEELRSENQFLGSNIFQGEPRIRFPQDAQRLPEHELELAEAVYDDSPRSRWPSPLQALWSLLTGDKADGAEGPAARMETTVSEVRQELALTENDHGQTVTRSKEYTDDKGQRVRLEWEYQTDNNGNVVRDTKRRFEDGKEKEARHDDW